jgi:hypothetical protein
MAVQWLMYIGNLGSGGTGVRVKAPVSRQSILLEFLFDVA